MDWSTASFIIGLVPGLLAGGFLALGFAALCTGSELRKFRLSQDELFDVCLKLLARRRPGRKPGKKIASDPPPPGPGEHPHDLVD